MIFKSWVYILCYFFFWYRIELQPYVCERNYDAIFNLNRYVAYHNDSCDCIYIFVIEYFFFFTLYNLANIILIRAIKSRYNLLLVTRNKIRYRSIEIIPKIETLDTKIIY